MKKILYIFLFFALVSKGFSQNVSDIYNIVDEMPAPKDGISSFTQYINQNIVYPKSVKEGSVSGKCYVKFIVEEDGGLSNIVVLKGVSNCLECDQEAIRVVSSYNQKWNPGKQKGKLVRTYYNLPINFKIK